MKEIIDSRALGDFGIEKHSVFSYNYDRDGVFDSCCLHQFVGRLAIQGI